MLTSNVKSESKKFHKVKTLLTILQLRFAFSNEVSFMRERDKETERHRDSETQRQRDRETERYRESGETERHIDNKTIRNRDAESKTE